MKIIISAFDTKARDKKDIEFSFPAGTGPNRAVSVQINGGDRVTIWDDDFIALIRAYLGNAKDAETTGAGGGPLEVRFDMDEK